MPKEKLTLSVDKEVVDKAKNLGINISEITERVLKGYTSAEKPEGSIYDAYQELFDSILPLLTEFDCEVKISESWFEPDDENRFVEDECYFTQYGNIHVKGCMGQPDCYLTDIKKIRPEEFLSPDKILSNLVKELAQAQEKRNEKMEGILMAKRIIEAMSESLLKKKVVPEK